MYTCSLKTKRDSYKIFYRKIRFLICCYVQKQKSKPCRSRKDHASVIFTVSLHSDHLMYTLLYLLHNVLLVKNTKETLFTKWNDPVGDLRSSLDCKHQRIQNATLRNSVKRIFINIHKSSSENVKMNHWSCLRAGNQT